MWNVNNPSGVKVNRTGYLPCQETSFLSYTIYNLNVTKRQGKKQTGMFFLYRVTNES